MEQTTLDIKNSIENEEVSIQPTVICKRESIR